MEYVFVRLPGRSSKTDSFICGGLTIEFIVAQWKKQEIHEGFLVTGFIIPLIIPATCPLWILALAVAFAVIFAKELFGGTGMNFLNVALIARAFIFFAYPTVITGETVWVVDHSILGLGADMDGLTAATPLGIASTTAAAPEFNMNMVWGLIPGSVGETSVVAIALGALLLLYTGIASWKQCFRYLRAAYLWLWSLTSGPIMQWLRCPYEHICRAVSVSAPFMATDPVTRPVLRQASGLRSAYRYNGNNNCVLNPAPEGMMLVFCY